MLNLCKKILALLYMAMILSPFSASAYNPCNEIWYVFGTYTFPDHCENWNGGTHCRREGPLCPPWNKTDRSGCLKQFPLAHEWEIVYNKYCAEASPRNSYFNPTIRVRVQTCNLGCWSMSDHLSGDGECTVYPGAFGVPTMRLCARIALPAEPATGSPANHGYTYAWHLNHEGAPTLDPIYVGDDGQQVVYARPKVCAYWDPSFFDSLANYASFLFAGAAAGAAGVMSVATAVASPSTVQLFKDSAGDNSAADVGMNLLNMLQANLQPDLWDLNPVHQAIHYHEGGVFFVFQLLIQLVKMGVGMADMMDSLVDALPDGLKYAIMVLSSMYWIMKAFSIIGPEVMVPVLEYLGQFNNVVAQALGCTLISLGPYPPPYCQDIVLPPPRANLTPICRTTTSGIEAANGINKCVGSTLVNNAIRNSVRVGFRDLKMICPQGVSPGDSCVRVLPTLNASSLHTMTNGTDVLNVCNAAQSNLPCVESPTLLQRCAQDPAWCSQGIRIVFGVRAGTRDPVTMRDNFDTTLQSCLTASGTCQLVWGVNIGNWQDYSLTFPALETGHNTAQLVSPTYSMVDPNGDSFDFKLMIPRANGTIDNVEVDSSSIFLVDDSIARVYDSVTRADAPRPTVYDCNSQGVNCTSHHLRPAIVAKIDVGADSTKGALSAETHLSPIPLGTLSNHKLNLAGKDFTAFVTDDQYRISPFEDANAINPSTRHGDYINYTPPLTFDQQGAISPASAMYTGGLEYYQNKYVMGGEQICLTGYQFNDCFTSNTRENCVLVNLSNDDKVRCTDFVNMVFTTYNGIGLCNGAQVTQYNTIETIQVPKPSSGTLAVTVKGQTASGPFCYDWSGRTTSGKLCDKTQLSSDRQDPSSAFGAVLPAAQFYNYNPQNPPNAGVFGVRNKNAVEHGMCVDVPDPPSCAAISESGANWAATNMGAQATGTCQLGGVPKGANALQRYCTIDRATLSPAWQPLNANMGCTNGCGITAINAGVASKYSYNAGTKVLALTTGALSAGVHHYHFTMDILDPSQINTFRFVSGGADDYFKLEVNGALVTSNNYSTTAGDRFNFLPSSPTNVNLIPNLVSGTNQFNVTVRVIGGGYSSADFLIDIPGCANVSISH